MERTNVIKVIGYTPILIELCIPYFFTILQKFFVVELFSHNLISVTEIALVFKRAPHLPFDSTATQELGKNAIVIRIQPYEGVTIRFGSKVPGGTTMEVRDVSMDFSYGRSFTESSPEAYERLILDVLLGDPPLFPTTQEVDLSWKILDPIEDFWSTLGQPQPYRAGTWGPQEAVEMLARDGHRWRMP